MKVYHIIILLIIMQPLNAFAQYPGEKNKDALQKLEFMIGKWKGEGWMMTREGGKESFVQSEDIEWKLDGEVMLVEGLGKKKEEKDKVIHHALAMVTYNPQAGDYDFRSSVAGRGSGNYKGKLLDAKTFQFFDMTLNKE